VPVFAVWAKCLVQTHEMRDIMSTACVIAPFMIECFADCLAGWADCDAEWSGILLALRTEITQTEHLK